MELKDFKPGNRVKHLYPLQEVGVVIKTVDFKTAAKSCLPSGERVFVRVDGRGISHYPPTALEKV